MEQLKELFDKNLLTIVALSLIAVTFTVAAVAAITGNYDSASVRLFVDDIKWIAGLLGAGVAVARGVRAAGDRAVQAQTLNSLTGDPDDDKGHGH